MRWLLLLSLAPLACSEAEKAPTGDARRALLVAWGEQIIMPGYATLASEAKALHDALDAYCAAPAGPAQQAAQAAWKRAKLAFRRMEVFNYGPSAELPQRFGPKLNFYPSRPESIDALLASDAALAPDGLGAPTRGLPAIEYALWRLNPEPRTCAYLAVLGDDLVTQTQALHDAWAPSGGDYVGVISEPRDPWPTLNDSLSQIVSRMGHVIENIRGERIGAALGSENTGPLPDHAEAPFADHAIDDALATLEALETLYAGPSPGLGLTDRISERKAAVDAEFARALAASREALAAIPRPLTDAVAAAPEKVRAALDALRDLQRVIQVDVVALLGLSLRFNDTDGD